MKLREYEFSKQIRKDTAFCDFVNDLSRIINQGLTAVIMTIPLTGQTGDISTTTIYTPVAAGLFKINVYMICTVAGGGTLTCTIGWTDIVGAKTLEPASGVDLSSTANGAVGTSFISSGASAITYATAIAVKTGSPQYALYLVLEQLG